MSVLAYARIFGSLITISLALIFLAREFRNVEWKEHFRAVMSEKEGIESRAGWFTRYMERVLQNIRMVDKPYTTKAALVHLAVMFIGIFLITLVLRFFFVIGLAISGTVALVVYDGFWASRARRKEEAMANAFLRQGVEEGVHVLTATNRLDNALKRMAHTVRYAPLKIRLQELAEIINSPQFANPEEAFLWWANRLGIEEIQYFALVTGEARKYNVALEDLWLEMAEVLGKKLEYVKRIRSETSHQRTGGYFFYGMLAGTYLIAYPFALPYMPAGTRIAFWFVLGIMTFGLYMIIKRSQHIDV